MSHIPIHKTAFDFLYHSNNALKNRLHIFKKENRRLKKENRILKRRLKAKDFVPLPIVTVNDEGRLTGGWDYKITKEDEQKN
ncbi:MAG: hypothetical protein H8E55_51655 [Pelagibacterales bacterium]|nr:hypothetical protein [Pelagibacterales bacterium]